MPSDCLTIRSTKGSCKNSMHYSRLYAVYANHFAAGFATDENDKVIMAAPIIKYMIGWNIKAVQDYCERKSWVLLPVKEETDAD